MMSLTRILGKGRDAYPFFGFRYDRLYLANTPLSTDSLPHRASVAKDIYQDGKSSCDGNFSDQAKDLYKIGNKARETRS